MINIEVPRDGSSITYPLLLIEGCIKSRLHDRITLYNTTTGSKTAWPVVQDRFKCFALLTYGCNKIKLQHGYFTRTMEVNRIADDCARTSYRILPLYVVFKDSDGLFQSPEKGRNSLENGLKRISLACALLQTFTAVNIGMLLGIEPHFTFQFMYDEVTCLPHCETFYSKYSTKDVYQHSETDLWKLLAKELMESNLPHLQATKYVMFLSNTQYHGQKWEPNWRHRDVVAATEGYVAIGGGGLAVLGTATLHTWAEKLEDLVQCLTDDTNIDKARFMDDSAYRGTHWANYATGLGALLHELGHTLDLSHTTSGIMARGDNIHTFFVLDGAESIAEDMSYDSLEAKLAELQAEVKTGTVMSFSDMDSSSQPVLIPNLQLQSTLTVTADGPQPHAKEKSNVDPDPTSPTLSHMNAVKPERSTYYKQHDTHDMSKQSSLADFSNWDLCSAVMLRYSRWLLSPLELQQSYSKPYGTCGRVEAEAGVRTVQIYCRCLDAIVNSQHHLADPPPHVVHPVELMNSIQHKSDCGRVSCLEAHIRDSAGNLLKVRQQQS